MKFKFFHNVNSWGNRTMACKTVYGRKQWIEVIEFSALVTNFEPYKEDMKNRIWKAVQPDMAGGMVGRGVRK